MERWLVRIVALFALASCASPPTRAAARTETAPLSSAPPPLATPPDDRDAGEADAETDASPVAAEADAEAPDAARAFTCPDDMVLAQGQACTAVRQECAEWVEAPTIGKDGRCKKFLEPSVCVGARVAMHVCIDRDEHAAGADPKPMTTVSWSDAKSICEKAGKRLCKESEWNFACEGEEMLPYPTGYDRPIGKCNFDQHKLVDVWGKVIDFRKRSSELVECTSPFGARNLVGNVDEWVERDVMNGQWRSALKGGWWLAGRNRCRPATTAHDEHYRDFQTGFRCCADPRVVTSM
jgi:hypothetical protein